MRLFDKPCPCSCLVSVDLLGHVLNNVQINLWEGLYAPICNMRLLAGAGRLLTRLYGNSVCLHNTLIKIIHNKNEVCYKIPIVHCQGYYAVQGLYTDQNENNVHFYESHSIRINYVVCEIIMFAQRIELITKIHKKVFEVCML